MRMRLSVVRHVLPLCGLLALVSCAGKAHTSSPWEFGGGFVVAPGYDLGESGATVHPMVSYTLLRFDGGRDHLFEFGGQVRKPIAAPAGWWVGVEGAGAYLRTTYSNSTFTEGTAGWSVTGLFGRPVGESKWGVHFYGGAGFSHYGSFGKNVRVGIDLQPWFLKKK